jgi:sarcosine oxidase
MKIAIVGAGVMGLSTALACQSRQHQVTLFEQFDGPHTLGSSHGNSRIVRLDYPDPFYLQIMTEAYPLWHQLNKTLNPHIFTECGIFTFGLPSHPDLISLQAGLINHNIPHDQLDSTQSYFPALKLQPDEIAIHNFIAGWANPNLFRSTATTRLLANGAIIVNEFIPDPSKLLSQFDRVTVTAGAWAKQLYSLPVKVNCQTFAYLSVPNPVDHTKVWIEAQNTGPDQHGIYGFPPEPGQSTIKFGVHSPGPEVDPTNPDRPVSAEKLDLLLDFARRRFGLSNPELINPQSCLYTSTVNTDFIWGEPEPNLFFASPCSGHGFKFAPWIGERLADFAEGKLIPGDYPRFCRT